MTDVILMRNPITGDVARATERAFKLAHEPKGWERVDPDKVTKDELLEAAERLGAPADPSDTKAEIVGDLTGADDNDTD